MNEVKHLDPRADNYLGFDREEQAWVLVQTWHVYLHKVRAPRDKYELRQFRCAVKFDHEPSDLDLQYFAYKSRKMLQQTLETGRFTSDLNVETGETEEWRFNRWKIKDLRQP